MTGLRYNPLLDDWTMVASHRQDRPDRPQQGCPFCPDSGQVPSDYSVLAYDNDFPALMANPPDPEPVGSSLYRTRPALGKCEVILYTPQHEGSLARLAPDRATELVNLWTGRYKDLGANPDHRYVLIFENRGAECGATISHPHGQIYAYSHLPLKIRVELENCQRHFQDTGRCLLCDINEEEIRFQDRLVYDNQDFLSYIPFFTDYPYGVFISSKHHLGSLADFDAGQRANLANALQHVTGAMDALFDRDFPYMMVLHQSPVDGQDTSDYYHFHIEFYPPLRSADSIKYYASSELGAWAACNTVAVEDTAGQFRQAHQRFVEQRGVDK